uniref:Uncharacterized protein n=1 Tax=Ditylenchus dipsaci TaxID=166011 RepID=A0A915EHY5_9BILA
MHGVDEEVTPEEAIDIEGFEVDQLPITRIGAQRALAVIRQFVEENAGDPAVLNHSDALDDFLQEMRQKKQSQITNFFSYDVKAQFPLLNCYGYSNKQ